MKTVSVVIDEELEQVRICACGCNLQFVSKIKSRRIYLNRKHKDMAKDARRNRKKIAPAETPETVLDRGKSGVLRLDPPFERCL
jgi:hypothetical protein